MPHHHTQHTTSHRPRNITRAFSLYKKPAIIALLAILAIIALIGYLIHSHINKYANPNVSHHDAQQFDKQTNTKVVDFYNNICTAHNTIIQAGEPLEDIPKDSKPEDTPGDVRTRIIGAIMKQKEGVDQAITTLHTTNAPTKVQYLGKKDKKDFQPTLEQAEKQYKNAENSLQQAVDIYHTVPDNDQNALSTAQDQAQQPLSTFSQSVTNTINMVFDQAPIPTRATQDKISQDTTCSPLFSESNWANNPLNKNIDEAAMNLVTKLGEVRGQLRDGMEPLSQFEPSSGDSMTVGEARKQLLKVLTPLRDAVNHAHDTMEGYEPPELYYPRTGEQQSTEPVKFRVMQMLNTQRDSIGGITSEVENAKTADALREAQGKVENAVRGFNSDVFTTFKDASGMIDFPTDATRKAASESPVCEGWCAF